MIGEKAIQACGHTNTPGRIGARAWRGAVAVAGYGVDDVTNIAQKSLLADEKENVPTGVGVVVWKVLKPEDKRKDVRDCSHDGRNLCERFC
ncbi:hypothetical protein AV530_017239 [Patagioenas fasciata monilis]|uniref:Uncharacterized protein n=1 Tax=Patagioenas fasciata monilis TaxID=372326 RepID=A0A1V4JF96_PATFA|nr:hypothetical protein AV530_017239 [Patagioenas fasciata monilis]